MRKVLILLVLVFAVCGFKCDSGKNQTANEDPLNVIKFNYTTAHGLTVCAPLAVDQATLDAMDAAKVDLEADLKALNYDLAQDATPDTVLINEQCIDRNGIKVWLDRADNYDGLVYDQHNTKGPETDPKLIEQGFVWAKDGIGESYRPEQMLWTRRADGLLVPSGEIIICRDNVETMGRTTRYGEEHKKLFTLDRNLYQATETHQTGGHPIVPSRQQ